MKSNPVADEKEFVNLLISWISRQEGTPTRNEVEETAEKLAGIYDFKTNLEPVITEALTAVDTRMGAGVSLVDNEAPHDDEWVSKRNDITWTYSGAYEEYLKGERWAPPVIQSLSDVSARILGHLQDPASEGDWDRRGLVIGHVQSGKTANYMGVIARAADAGYKFIIVIAGIHNNLRKQTQERIDEGFVGRSSEPGNRVSVGVGIKEGYPYPATLTNIHHDFKKNTAAQSGWKINDFTKPVILVIKKNVRTLDSLHNWLKDMNAQGRGRISDVPMLMIDDEADHASINTNREDIDPTRTNAMIRKILRLFAKSCYVGYTATPFANIFINPESYGDEEVYKELFPRDFIYCLDPPSTYFGPERVFLDEDDSAEEILEPIIDCENYLPQTHKNYYEIPDLPPSLYQAIDQFIVARAIRNLRGHANRHCSMMINVSRFVVVQQSVRNLISVYLKKMREAVKANYKMPDAVADHNEYMQALKERFIQDYKRCGADWRDVKKELFVIWEHLGIYTINSKSDEVLDYKKYEREGHGLTAIAVGGLSLSRGLTIEGLCVSYMYRNTRMYDTLMQMGRWFGFRPSYEDLCRVHLSDDSINWYAHIADASKELRQQIRRMRQADLSPTQFGLYVKAHPDSLLITARNKMRSGESVKLKLNLSAKLIESYTLPVHGDINQRNEKLIAKYWQAGFGRQEIERTAKGWIVRDVPTGVIEEFLFEFVTHPSFTDRKNHANQYLQALSARYTKGDVLLISLQNNDEDAKQYRLGVQERGSAQNKGDAWRMSKDRVASRGDEKLGLTPQQEEDAEALSLKDDPPPKAPSDIHFRIVRNKPLLMLHVINPSRTEQQRVPAFGISFPENNYETEIEVVANTVWIEQMYDTSTDSPDQEDDYDE
ncbi:MAG: Z1 domain-containing protein [Gammaproteobacteria bacterium]|nr:Z1 domain-containing protein [Gammaproteobacteria bacterium]